MNINSLPRNLWAFMWHFLKHYKGFVISFTIIAALAGCQGPFSNLLIKSIINTLAAGTTTHLSWYAVLLVANFIVFDNFTWRTLGYLNYKYEAVIKNEVISQTFEYILGSSYQYFQNNLSGRVANQITTLADNMERIIHRIAADFMRGASLLIISLISMYLVNTRFFYTLLIWSIVFSLTSIALSKFLVSLSDKHAEAESQNSGELVDSITNAHNVRIFARRSYEVLRLKSSLSITKNQFQKKNYF